MRWDLCFPLGCFTSFWRALCGQKSASLTSDNTYDELLLGLSLHFPYGGVYQGTLSGMTVSSKPAISLEDPAGPCLQKRRLPANLHS